MKINKFPYLINKELIEIKMEISSYYDLSNGKERSVPNITFIFNDSILKVSNPIKLKFNGEIFESDIAIKKLNNMTKCSVVNAYTIPQEDFVVEFDNGCSMIISLRDKDYEGPEAAVYHGPNNKIIVFN
jgi:hypothetical protein